MLTRWDHGHLKTISSVYALVKETVEKPWTRKPKGEPPGAMPMKSHTHALLEKQIWWTRCGQPQKVIQHPTCIPFTCPISANLSPWLPLPIQPTQRSSFLWYLSQLLHPYSLTHSFLSAKVPAPLYVSIFLLLFVLTSLYAVHLY